jgi:hypothetical protein
LRPDAAAPPARIDGELQTIIDCWDALPSDVRKLLASVARSTVEANKVRK